MKELSKENVMKELWDNPVLVNTSKIINETTQSDVLYHDYVVRIRQYALAIIIKCDDYLLK